MTMWWREHLRIEFEGMLLILSNDEIKMGDTYVTERNTGPKLLTCRSVNKEYGFIVPAEDAYPYDIGECRKVIEFREI